MSLMRLLAAGSSLRGIKDRRSPYKMTQQHLLPKFGAKEGEPQPLPAVAPPTPPPIPSSAVGSSPKGGGPGEIIGPHMNIDPIEVHPAAEQPAVPLKSEAKVRTSFWPWMRSRNPFQPRLVNKKSTAPIQGELVLESVKVVRNDLNEADLELVPLPAQSGTDQPSGRALGSPEAARVAWQRITARLFGVRRT